MKMLDRSQLKNWLAWCRRVETILSFERGDVLSRIAGTPAATMIIATIEDEALKGERLAQLLGPGDASEAAQRSVARLDCISGRLCDLVHPPAGPPLDRQGSFNGSPLHTGSGLRAM
jgi:hypothetical protein